MTRSRPIEGERTAAEAAAFARLYDLDLVEDPGDVDLYLALAGRVGGPILELGVGTGRLAVPLAAAGYDVTGVDLDPAMLARARSRAAAARRGVVPRIQLVQGDARDVRLPGRGTFRLALVALNSLMVMGDAPAQRAVVQTLADHLAPGGLAVVDVWLPDADDLGRYDGRLVLEYTRRDPETGLTVTKAGSALHDAASASVILTTIYEESTAGTPAARWIRRDHLRLVGADELRVSAEAAGLEVEVVAGSYELDPLGRGADRAILVAVRS